MLTLLVSRVKMKALLARPFSSLSAPIHSRSSNPAWLPMVSMRTSVSSLRESLMVARNPLSKKSTQQALETGSSEISIQHVNMFNTLKPLGAVWPYTEVYVWTRFMMAYGCGTFPYSFLSVGVQRYQPRHSMNETTTTVLRDDRPIKLLNQALMRKQFVI